MSGCVGRAVVVGVAVVVLVCSCSGEGSTSGGPGSGGAGVQQSSSPVATSSSPVVTSPSSPVSSMPVKPQPSGTFTPEQLEAANTVIEYFRISDEVSSSLDSDPQPLKDITMGQTQELDMEVVDGYRRRGQVQTGVMVVAIIGASDAREEDGVRVVAVQVCTDSSKADVVDSRTGQSIFEPGKRSMYLEWNIDVVKTAEGWKIGDSTNESVLGCRA